MESARSVVYFFMVAGCLDPPMLVSVARETKSPVLNPGEVWCAAVELEPSLGAQAGGEATTPSATTRVSPFRGERKP